MRVACLLLLCLAGCAGQPERDPVAPAVVTKTVKVEVPVVVHREPPADLMEARDAAAPDIKRHGATCEGDYGITRAGLELMVDAMRLAQERLARWRAWAGEAR